MDLIVLVGRLLFALVFLVSALGHFTSTAAMAGYVQSKGLPYATPVVLISGVIIGAGAISVAAGIWADLGALVLAVFLVPTAFIMHNFWAEKDVMARQNDQIHFLKDLSLSGAAILMFGYFAGLDDSLGFTLTGALFSL